MKTREQLEAEDRRVDPPFVAWKEKYKDNPVAGIEALKTHPQADLIKKGHDLDLLYQQWIFAYRKWRPGIQWNDCGWRAISHWAVASNIKFHNIFTKRCNDLPDWRTDDDRAWDEAKWSKLHHWISEERALAAGRTNPALETMAATGSQ